MSEEINLDEIANQGTMSLNPDALELNITMLDVADIVPNDYNPNIMQEGEYEGLKKTIAREGFKQHILVRPHDIEAGKYIIIDGEHRWKILKELGALRMPCSIEQKSREEAMIETITMNKFRGEFDSVKLAEMLVELHKSLSPDQLSELTGFSKEEQASYVQMLDFDPTTMEQLTNDEAPQLDTQDDLDLTNEFSVALDLYGLDIVSTALSCINADNAVALVTLCTEYLGVKAPDKLAEVEGRKAQYGQATIDAAAGIVS